MNPPPARTPHDHVHQARHADARDDTRGCPACASLDRDRMDWEYAAAEWMRMRSEREWERALRE